VTASSGCDHCPASPNPLATLPPFSPPHLLEGGLSSSPADHDLCPRLCLLPRSLRLPEQHVAEKLLDPAVGEPATAVLSSTPQQSIVCPAACVQKWSRRLENTWLLSPAGTGGARPLHLN